MPIDNISNGETGAGVRAALNALIAAANLVGLGEAQDGITAHAGGGQADATQLGYGISNTTTVASKSDSVKLPPAVAGAICFLHASGANPANLFPSSGDTIAGGDPDAPIFLPLGGTDGGIILGCASDGAWLVFARS